MREREEKENKKREEEGGTEADNLLSFPANAEQRHKPRAAPEKNGRATQISVH